MRTSIGNGIVHVPHGLYRKTASFSTRHKVILRVICTKNGETNY